MMMLPYANSSSSSSFKDFSRSSDPHSKNDFSMATNQQNLMRGEAIHQSNKKKSDHEDDYDEENKRELH